MKLELVSGTTLNVRHLSAEKRDRVDGHKADDKRWKRRAD